MGINQNPAPGARIGPEAEISAWLRSGGWVVAASERAARAAAAAYHRARQAEGLAAWPAPAILDWQTFLRTAWQQQSVADDRLLLDPLQEQSIWADIAGSHQQLATQLEAPLYRIANLAAEAHKLLCSYAPQCLKPNARSAWQQDAASFSKWLAEFDDIRKAGKLLSASRLPLELMAQLDSSPKSFAGTQRPPLLLTGFDRILPIQRRVLDTWGKWQQVPAGERAGHIHFYAAPDSRSELIACALWCRQQLVDDPQARLLVITQDISLRRGEIERAFQSIAVEDGNASPQFEFSLGIPLSQTALARGAHLLLRFLSSDLQEHELDWLLSTEQLAADPHESIALQIYMRRLRDYGLERPQWKLEAFLSQPPRSLLPTAWTGRMRSAQKRLADHLRANRSHFEWAELVPQVLEAAGWPGWRPLSSEEFQTLRRWQQTLENCASLGFDGRRVSWVKFLSALKRALDATLFSSESHQEPIQISGPTEAGGLTADGIWFMGANEDKWPATANMHPLLPPDVQRAASMPHATAQLDWDLAHAVTLRLIQSAPQVCFSYARQSKDGELRHSPLIAQFAGAPDELPDALNAPPPPAPLADFVEDSVLTPFPPGSISGGASVLTHQSQCPFKAFATSRLAAKGWTPAEAGLTAAQRGQLLHDVLHSIWGSTPPDGIRTRADLEKLENRAAFVARHVARAMQSTLREGVRERMPHRYLELEEQRLNRLVREWLDYESTRLEFEVLKTEDERTVNIAGLTFDLRLDRLDRLNDGTLLVVDYKTGSVNPKSWESPRPDDVQLPLYAGFALSEDEVLGGLVFAQVRSGDICFTGRVGDAHATLFPEMNGNCSLVKRSLTAEMMIDWKREIEMFASAFIAGRAETDPRDFPDTCKRCGLHTLCRIHETRELLVDDDAEGETAAAGSEAGDE
jgi:ATP-dependent helicase/nuclease subunit B